MTESLGRAELELATNQRQFDAGLQAGEAKAKGWTGRVQGTFDRLGKSSSFGAIMQGIGVGAGISAYQMVGSTIAGAMNIAATAIDDASDRAENLSKVRVVFGELAGEIEDFAKDSAQNMGLSEKAALGMVGTFGNLFDALGLSDRATVDMSKSVLQLGADLASFNNINVEDALEKLRAGLVGEAEPLRALGVNLTETAVAAKAVEMGLAASTGQVSQAAKVQARYALILEQTTNAQGDYERTSDGLANTQRTLAAEMENVSAELGEALLPLMLELSRFAKDVVVPALRLLLDVTGAVAHDIGEAWRALEDLFGVSEMRRRLEELKDAQIEAGNAAVEMAGNADAAASHYMAMGGAMESAASTVETGARSMASVVETEWDKAHKAAVVDARALPGDLAQALKDGQADVESGMEELTTLMEESLSDAAKIAHLKGVLASKELAAGLRDERADVRAAALAVQADALEQLELLESGAADAAVDSGTTFAEQLRLQSGAAGRAAAEARRAASGALRSETEFRRAGEVDMAAYAAGLRAGGASARTAAQYALQLVRNQFAGSEPRDPQSPLRGITTAFGFWDVFAGGLKGDRGVLDDVLGRAAQALTMRPPQLALGGVGAAGQAALGGVSGTGLTQQWILNVEGVPKTVGTKREAIEELEKLGDTWG
jgi:hypothetical protein